MFQLPPVYRNPKFTKLPQTLKPLNPRGFAEVTNHATMFERDLKHTKTFNDLYINIWISTNKIVLDSLYKVKDVNYESELDKNGVDKWDDHKLNL